MRAPRRRKSRRRARGGRCKSTEGRGAGRASLWSSGSAVGRLVRRADGIEPGVSREMRGGRTATPGVLLYLRRLPLPRSYVAAPPDDLTAGAILLRLLAVLLLVLANAFFVSAEFGLVGARRSRIDALASRGDRRAKLVQETLKHLDLYISATQLGITLSSLALGWIGEATMATVLDRLLRAFGYMPSPTLTH